MAYAEQVTTPGLSQGIIANLLEWTRRAGTRSPVMNIPAGRQADTALDPDVAIDTAARREFSEYGTSHAVAQGSQARLHRIAESIASTLPR